MPPNTGTSTMTAAAMNTEPGSATASGNGGMATPRGFKRVKSTNSVRYSPLNMSGDDGEDGNASPSTFHAGGSETKGDGALRKKVSDANLGTILDTNSYSSPEGVSQTPGRTKAQPQQEQQQGAKTAHPGSPFSTEVEERDEYNRRYIKGYSWATPYDFQIPPKPSRRKIMEWILMYCMSFFFTVIFLTLVVVPALLNEFGRAFQRMWYRITHCSTPYATRLFYAEETERRARRRVAEKEWVKNGKRRKWTETMTAERSAPVDVPVDPEYGILSPPEVAGSAREADRQRQMSGEAGSVNSAAATDIETARANEVTIQVEDDDDGAVTTVRYTPSVGGPDPLNHDVSYYARRVGLDAEEYTVLTKDGYILELFHIYNPREYTPRRPSERQMNPVYPFRYGNDKHKKRRYPFLMMSGLLQHVGSYCTNDDASLAFYFTKIGFDVWLGGNRCGFNPRHIHLSRHDPKFWNWNVRHMGIFDLPAHLSRVRYETGFEKVALVAHSQGTTQTMYALSHPKLAPGIASQISVACLLAPAAYAGPTLDSVPFRFVRSLPHSVYSVIFGKQSFIPAMVHAQHILPKRFVTYMAYAVFNYLFNWTDARWERHLRARMFGFAPVFVSAEHMWWWLSKTGFAGRGCMFWEGDADPVIRLEEVGAKLEPEPSMEEVRERDIRTGVITEDNPAVGEGTKKRQNEYDPNSPGIPASLPSNPFHPPVVAPHIDENTPWFSTPTPPLALFIPACDELVDGPRLLKRLTAGKHPYTSPTPSTHPSSSTCEIEPNANICHVSILDDYEHLDPLWAIDSVDRVGTKIRDIVWNEIVKEREKEEHDPLLDRLVVPKQVGWPEEEIGKRRASATRQSQMN
ncbi:hypothetical protein KEM56_006444 [Ascosphaera pollenicola]|nr:hypothetical protein KEM56_006444 [Ascosphaera pollenicola]